jgi:hypothetical protein
MFTACGAQLPARCVVVVADTTAVSASSSALRAETWIAASGKRLRLRDTGVRRRKLEDLRGGS